MTNSIQQSGSVTPGHIPVFVQDGVVQDGGSATAGIIQEIGLQNNGNIALAINDVSPSTPGGYHELGFSVANNGTITLYAEAFNGAPPALLVFNINGTNYPFNPAIGGGNVTGPVSSVNGDLVSFYGVTGENITDSGLSATSVATVLSGFSSSVPAVASIATLEAATTSSLSQPQCYVLGYATAGDGGEGPFVVGSSGTPNGGTLIEDASGRFWHRLTLGQPYSVKWFGAKGDGATNDLAAIQATITAAIANGTSVYMPGNTPGYLVSTPINLTNLAGSLTITGDGIIAPAFNQALSAPARGSIILGGTGTGNCMLDMSGSNNVVLRDINFCAIGVTNPSTIGVISGTSTTAATIASPGGAGISLQNVAFYMQNANASIGFAAVGGSGPYNLDNVWSLAVTACYLSNNNVKSIASSFVSFALGGGIDGLTARACAFLGYASTALYMEGCSAHTWSELYVATIISGAGYSGAGVGIYMKNTLGCTMTVECDYFPGVLELDGVTQGLSISGTTFPGTTPLTANDAIFVFFNGTSIVNCEFDLQSHTGEPSNYFYTSAGVSPTLVSVNSCTLTFNTGISNLIAFINTTAGGPVVPFFNLYFNGDADGGTVNTLINGGAPTNANKRYWVNGIRVGTG